MKETKAGIQDRNLEVGTEAEKPCKNAIYQLGPPGLCVPTVCWTHPHQSLVKRASYGLAYKSNEGIFSTEVPLLR